MTLSLTLTFIALITTLLSGLSAVRMFDIWVLRRNKDALALAILSVGTMLTMAGLQDHATVAF